MLQNMYLMNLDVFHTCNKISEFKGEILEVYFWVTKIWQSKAHFLNNFLCLSAIGQNCFELSHCESGGIAEASGVIQDIN